MTPEIHLVAKQEKEKSAARSNVVVLGPIPSALQVPPTFILDDTLPALPRAVSMPSGAVEEPVSTQAAALAHDARNLFSALNLFCELLSSPGVLTARFGHYAEDLRRVGEAGVRLIEALASEASPQTEQPLPFGPRIENLASELMAMQEILRAIAGPEIQFEIECAPGIGGVALSSEELLRILFNLVTNAAEALHRQAEEAMPGSPRHRGMIRITVQRGGAASFLSPGQWTSDPAKTVVLSVRDNGPGIDELDLPHIFDPGYSTRPAPDRRLTSAKDGLRGAQLSGCYRRDLRSSQGLGLFIVRGLVETAGGAVRVFSSPRLGTRFDIELPVSSAADVSYPIEACEINSTKTSIPFREGQVEC